MSRWRRLGVSLVEGLLALVISIVVLYTAYTLLTAGRRLEEGMGAHLGLQAEAHKALVQLIRELQEAICVIQPAPGHTLPHLLVRDKLNRLAFYSLTPASIAGEFTLRRHLISPTGVVPNILTTGVSRATFTALSDGAVQMHVILGAGERRYAFHTMIRLRNRDAAADE